MFVLQVKFATKKYYMTFNKEKMRKTTNLVTFINLSITIKIYQIYCIEFVKISPDRLELGMKRGKPILADMCFVTKWTRYPVIYVVC